MQENEKIKELKEENKRLKEENEELKRLMKSKIIAGSMTPYQIIASTISNKVYDEVKGSFKQATKQSIKRKIMDDLKWELHVRYANDFKEEHIESAKAFIDNYKIDDFYKKEEYTCN